MYFCTKRVISKRFLLFILAKISRISLNLTEINYIWKLDFSKVLWNWLYIKHSQTMLVFNSITRNDDIHTYIQEISVWFSANWNIMLMVRAGLQYWTFSKLLFSIWKYQYFTKSNFCPKYVYINLFLLFILMLHKI